MLRIGGRFVSRLLRWSLIALRRLLPPLFLPPRLFVGKTGVDAQDCAAPSALPSVLLLRGRAGVLLLAHRFLLHGRARPFLALRPGLLRRLCLAVFRFEQIEQLGINVGAVFVVLRKRIF